MNTNSEIINIIKIIVNVYNTLSNVTLRYSINIDIYIFYGNIYTYLRYNNFMCLQYIQWQLFPIIEPTTL